MDHKQVVELQLAVKYVLGELPPVQRDEYEDHYIDCPECAKEVYAVAAFTDTAREVFRQEVRGEEPAPVRERGGWFAWLKPAFAVPAFAVLLLVVIYQNAVTIPQAKQEAVQSAVQMYTSAFSLQMANVRGGEEVKVQVHPSQTFALDFDFTPTRLFDSYLCQLQDASARSLLQVRIPGSGANKETHLVIPGGLVKPGKYTLVFGGDPGATGKLAKQNEVSRIPFVIEFYL